MMAFEMGRTREMLTELAHELEVARDVDGHWFGRYSMAPLSVSDDEIADLLECGLVDVLDWTPEPESLPMVDDPEAEFGAREVLFVTRPLYIRVSTIGWSLIV